MGGLVLNKVSKNTVFIDNIFYGRDVSFMLQCDKQPLQVEVRRHDTQFSVAIKLTIARHSCTLFLEELPPLDTFSKQFEGIVLSTIPLEIRLLVFQVATEQLQNHFSNILQTTISIDAIDILKTNEITKGIDFVLTSEQKHIAAGTLAAPKEIITLLAKKIKKTASLHSFKNLEMIYHVCIGSTQLSKEDYRTLSEEDIVFLDQHELAKEKKVDIVGPDGVKIRGSFTSSGVIVQQITA